MFARDDLSDLKAGDKAALEYDNYGSTRYEVVEIEKVTPTGFMRVRGELYDRHGRKRGGTYRSADLVRITPEVENAMERRALLNRVDTIKFKDMSLDQLRRIVAIADEKSD